MNAKYRKVLILLFVAAMIVVVIALHNSMFFRRGALPEIFRIENLQVESCILTEHGETYFSSNRRDLELLENEFLDKEWEPILFRKMVEIQLPNQADLFISYAESSCRLNIDCLSENSIRITVNGLSSHEDEVYYYQSKEAVDLAKIRDAFDHIQ